MEFATQKTSKALCAIDFRNQHANANPNPEPSLWHAKFSKHSEFAAEFLSHPNDDKQLFNQRKKFKAMHKMQTTIPCIR